MNERIKELAQQAMTATTSKFSADREWSADEWRDFYDAKFAELIVKECEAKHFSEGYLCGKRDGRILAIHECSEYLRERGDISRSMDLEEHFGVEE